jgi:hypothetical protein
MLLPECAPFEHACVQHKQAASKLRLRTSGLTLRTAIADTVCTDAETIDLYASGQ